MKHPILAAIACQVALAGICPGEATPEIKVGLDAMENIAQLPLLFPNGTQTRQPLAYDATGGNWDHHVLAAFTKYIETRDLPDGSKEKEYVIYDEYGPGCLYRQQMNAWIDGSAHPDMWVPKGRLDQPRANANIRFYFDDEARPRIDMHLSEFFAAKTAPFNEPLSFMDHMMIFANSYYPLSYAKRLKISLRPNAESFVTMDSKWYQHTALSFPADTEVTTWQGPAVDSTAVRAQWAKSGENPNDLAGCEKTSRDFAIKAGQTATVFETEGAGSIVGLRMTLTPYTLDTFFNTSLKIFWDGSDEPAVDLPLSYLFGAGAKDYPGTAEKVFEKSLTTLLYGFDRAPGSFYCYWPMPFWKSARIEVANRSKADLERLSCEVLFKPSSVLDYPERSTGHFHARRTTDGDPDTLGYRGVAFSETGRGHVVGVTFYSDKYDMDGDEFVYFDDSRTPQVHGSGTEDDHNQGWAGREHQKPLWGALINGYNGAYRTYLNDCYIFNRNILIAYEYSLMKKERLPSGGRTDVTIFYYKSSAGPNLHLTDEIDVGNHFSEAQHGYKVSGQTWQGIRTDDYDGYERNMEFGRASDDGRAFKGSSRFTAAISADNVGVKLRKRINRRDNGVQTAEVFVNGRKVGRPWHIVTPSLSTGKAELDGWFDSDFEIPASFTRGLDRIEVEVRFVGSAHANGINEFLYWVYSYTGQ
jgi:hypothetical protein